MIRWIGWEIRITPACAGSTAVSIGSKCLSQDHPRLRGEYSACAKPLLRFWGSPPLARGVLTSLIMLLTGKRITPACAGSTRKRTGEFFLYGDHPRLRGEYRIDFKQCYFKRGSPPLARGVHYCTNESRYFVRITPACAGSTY